MGPSGARVEFLGEGVKTKEAGHQTKEKVYDFRSGGQFGGETDEDEEESYARKWIWYEFQFRWC